MKPVGTYIALVAAAVLNASAATAGDGGARPADQGSACNAMCRSWMGLDKAEATGGSPAPAAAPRASAAAPPRPVAAAREPVGRAIRSAQERPVDRRPKVAGAAKASVPAWTATAAKAPPARASAVAAMRAGVPAETAAVPPPQPVAAAPAMDVVLSPPPPVPLPRIVATGAPRVTVPAVPIDAPPTPPAPSPAISVASAAPPTSRPAAVTSPAPTTPVVTPDALRPTAEAWTPLRARIGLYVLLLAIAAAAGWRTPARVKGPHDGVALPRPASARARGASRPPQRTAITYGGPTSRRVHA